MCDLVISVGGVLGSLAFDNYKPLVLATLSQHFFAWFYYSTICGEPWARAMCKDKGVKGLDQMKHYYSMGFAIIASFVCSFFRALFVLLFAVKTQGEEGATLCSYTDAALIVAAFIAIHHHLETLSQRGCLLQIADFIFETVAAVLSAAVLFYAKTIF